MVKPKKEKSPRNRSVSRSTERDNRGEAGSTITAVSGRTAVSWMSSAVSSTSCGRRRTATAINDVVIAPPRKLRREKPPSGASGTGGSPTRGAVERLSLSV